MATRKWLKFITYATGIALVSLALLAGLTAYLLHDSCSEEELTQTTSPSGLYETVVIKKDCGATTSYSYHVFVGKTDSKRTRTRLAWFDGLRGAKNSSGLVIRWIDDANIEISYSKANNAVIESKETKIGSATITTSLRQETGTPALGPPQ